MLSLCFLSIDCWSVSKVCRDLSITIEGKKTLQGLMFYCVLLGHVGTYIYRQSYVTNSDKVSRAVHMSRASPASRADSVVSRPMVA